jgi:hypothetical protein
MRLKDMLRKKTRCYYLAAVALASVAALVAQSVGKTPAYLDPKRPMPRTD